MASKHFNFQFILKKKKILSVLFSKMTAIKKINFFKKKTFNKNSQQKIDKHNDVVLYGNLEYMVNSS